MLSLSRPVVPRDARRPSRTDRDQVPQMRHDQPTEACRARRTPRASNRRRSELWLYVPKMNASAACRSVPELEAWTSDCTSRSPDTRLCAMSSGTLTRQPASWRGWRTRPYVRLLSGPTYEPSTAALGAAAWISCLPVTPASLSRRPASGSASEIRAICGPTSPASSGSASRRASFSRTSRDTCLWDFPSSPKSYERWATELRRACSRRSKSARLTFGEGSSLWPTPTASDFANGVDITIDAKGPRFSPEKDEGGKQVGMRMAARNWAVMWETMTALGWMPVRPPSTRFSRPLLSTIRLGRRSSPSDVICNPDFLDWSMGWPPGWSDVTRPVTGSSRWLQRSRTALSTALERVKEDLSTPVEG